MFKQDYHLHSRFSPDSSAEPADILRAAAERGLDDIIFTEHCEVNGTDGVPEGTLWPPLDISSYTHTLQQLRTAGPVPFGIGIEIGQATQAPEQARKTVAAFDWDFIIGSLHNIRNEYDFYFMDFNGKDPVDLANRYFEELDELVRMDFFSVLGHIYYPLRYISRKFPDFDISRWDADMADIFRVLIRNGKGIEINTKGLGVDPCGAIPSVKYLKMYRELGGEIITFGSDNHTAAPGTGMQTAYDMMRKAGFSHVTSFRKMKPEFRDI